MDGDGSDVQNKVDQVTVVHFIQTKLSPQLNMDVGVRILVDAGSQFERQHEALAILKRDPFIYTTYIYSCFQLLLLRHLTFHKVV